MPRYTATRSSCPTTRSVCPLKSGKSALESEYFAWTPKRGLILRVWRLKEPKKGRDLSRRSSWIHSSKFFALFFWQIFLSWKSNQPPYAHQSLLWILRNSQIWKNIRFQLKKWPFIGGQTERVVGQLERAAGYVLIDLRQKIHTKRL